MRKFVKRLMVILVIVLVVWLVLTLWVEAEGPSQSIEMGNSNPDRMALIIYDPDPFYNLDQQVCESFAKGLFDNNWQVTIATVRAAKKIKDTSFHLYVFCANTYNWLPDWAVTRCIKKQLTINDKNVIAITLGAGSTGSSRKVFESIFKNKKAKLIDSRTFWLWRPKESNVAVAVHIAGKWEIK